MKDFFKRLFDEIDKEEKLEIVKKDFKPYVDPSTQEGFERTLNVLKELYGYKWIFISKNDINRGVDYLDSSFTMGNFIKSKGHSMWESIVKRINVDNILALTQITDTNLIESVKKFYNDTYFYSLSKVKEVYDEFLNEYAKLLDELHPLICSDMGISADSFALRLGNTLNDRQIKRQNKMLKNNSGKSSLSNSLLNSMVCDICDIVRGVNDQDSGNKYYLIIPCWCDEVSDDYLLHLSIEVPFLCKIVGVSGTILNPMDLMPNCIENAVRLNVNGLGVSENTKQHDSNRFINSILINSMINSMSVYKYEKYLRTKEKYFYYSKALTTIMEEHFRVSQDLKNTSKIYKLIKKACRYKNVDEYLLYMSHNYQKAFDKFIKNKVNKQLNLARLSYYKDENPFPEYN